MANANFTLSAFGIEFSRAERFGPITLKSMFGDALPHHFRVDRAGAVAVPVVLRHLAKQGETGLQEMRDYDLSQGIDAGTETYVPSPTA